VKAVRWLAFLLLSSSAMMALTGTAALIQFTAWEASGYLVLAGCLVVLALWCWRAANGVLQVAARVDEAGLEMVTPSENSWDPAKMVLRKFAWDEVQAIVDASAPTLLAPSQKRNRFQLYTRQGDVILDGRHWDNWDALVAEIESRVPAEVPSARAKEVAEHRASTIGRRRLYRRMGFAGTGIGIGLLIAAFVESAGAPLAASVTSVLVLAMSLMMIHFGQTAHR
jgi:hypothetical protein